MSDRKNAYCFLFYKREVIFQGHEHHPEFPSVGEVEELGINNSEIMYIGTADSNEYFAASISVMVSLNL